MQQYAVKSLKWRISDTIYKLIFIFIFINFLQPSLTLLSAFKVRVRSSNGPSHGVERKTLGCSRELEESRAMSANRSLRVW